VLFLFLCSSIIKRLDYIKDILKRYIKEQFTLPVLVDVERYEYVGVSTWEDEEAELVNSDIMKRTSRVSNNPTLASVVKTQSHQDPPFPLRKRTSTMITLHLSMALVKREEMLLTRSLLRVKKLVNLLEECVAGVDVE